MSQEEYAPENSTQTPRPHAHTKSTQRQAAEQIATDILSEASFIEFPDSSGAATASSGRDQSIDLTYMDRSKYGGNNCFGATTAIYRYVVENLGTEPHVSIHSVEILFDAGAHWANMVRDADTDEETIIDFTARQFDESVPFPYILPKDEWVTWVSDRIADLYNDTGKPVVTVDFGQE